MKNFLGDKKKYFNNRFLIQTITGINYKIKDGNDEATRQKPQTANKRTVSRAGKSIYKYPAENGARTKQAPHKSVFKGATPFVTIQPHRQAAVHLGDG